MLSSGMFSSFSNGGCSSPRDLLTTTSRISTAPMHRMVIRATRPAFSTTRPSCSSAPVTAGTSSSSFFFVGGEGAAVALEVVCRVEAVALEVTEGVVLGSEVERDGGGYDVPDVRRELLGARVEETFRDGDTSGLVWDEALVLLVVVETEGGAGEEVVLSEQEAEHISRNMKMWTW